MLRNKSQSRWTAAHPGLRRSISISPGAPAESYVAYGLTQKLFEACSRQGDYDIPQRHQKGAEIPVTESGEHLGVSDSWWYKGTPPSVPALALLCPSPDR